MPVKRILRGALRGVKHKTKTLAKPSPRMGKAKPMESRGRKLGRKIGKHVKKHKKVYGAAAAGGAVGYVAGRRRRRRS